MSDGDRLVRIEEKLDRVAEALAAHCAHEEGAKEIAGALAGKKSKWIDRAWTLGVCLAGCVLGFLLKR